MLSTPHRTIPPTRKVWSPTGINVYQKVSKMDQNSLRQHISKTSVDSYGQFAKQLQVKAVLNLVEGRNTFLLAGTGFGKSRIPELYYKMIPGKSKAVVLVLNPLDSLGENQVLEKQAAGFTAINLTKLTFNPETAAKIQKGVYQFVYLSPAIFLNSKLFETVYFSSDFQNRLALVVVDEAHMVYIWGLVESSTAKHLTSAHFRHEDSGIFRPSYGKLGEQLLFRNDKPILLLPATCRPVAVEAIKKSLKLNEDNVTTLHGELTRPEIRMVRVKMEKSLASSLDAIKLFRSCKDVSDSDMVPGLVYSGSRNRTLTVLEVIDRARETPGRAFIPDGLCARRFHSCTGDKDKLSTVEDFANGRYPVVSCTMALGLGQNWKRVRMVAHMGRGDPAAICQMIGRCGRDGKSGLAVMFVEKTRRGGKNRVDQFDRKAPQNDLDRMDALAITPLCLRVAFAMDNKVGYVPLWPDDPNYLNEVAHQEMAGMPACRCSNCAPEDSARLMKHLIYANSSNFDAILDDKFTSDKLKHKYPQKAGLKRKRKFTEADDIELADFCSRLGGDLYHHYDHDVSPGGTITASDLFTDEDATTILASIDHVYTASDLRELIGGDCFDGESDWIFAWIGRYRSSNLISSDSSIPAAKKTRKTHPSPPGKKVITQEELGKGPAPRGPTKKALAAEAARLRSMERKLAKEAKDAEVDRRRKQVLEIMTETKKHHEMK
ncbi:ATP-dependent DNA helicase sgs1 [Puccinia graminis f. sp. tritici]|uniref:DNA 3'-5' helicase n=1 Tax=Puccinia graminis f. sp. tritici TaxID=56615 RepID=A0A5B0S600_PUCGR|nr:ATP-dependent DNA helicase sgs1 [Puccinia graminis f. sp. tritici]